MFYHSDRREHYALTDPSQPVRQPGLLISGPGNKHETVQSVLYCFSVANSRLVVVVDDTEVHDSQNVDSEMQEEKASEAPESNPDQSSDANSAKEPCTTIEQNSPAPEKP